MEYKGLDIYELSNVFRDFAYELEIEYPIISKQMCIDLELLIEKNRINIEKIEQYKKDNKDV